MRTAFYAFGLIVSCLRSHLFSETPAILNQITPEDLQAIHAEIYAGRTIQAIKLHRKATGLGLRESKDAVEAMAVELLANNPDGFSVKTRGKDNISSRKGCLPILVLSAGAITALVML